MTSFVYTDTAEVESSAVDEVWYNGGNRELVLNLGGSIYKYLNVPPFEYSGLVNAGSVGRYYQDEIKGEYTSSWLAYNYNFTPIPMAPQPVAVGGLSVTDNTQVVDDTPTYHSLKVAEQPSVEDVPGLADWERGMLEGVETETSEGDEPQQSYVVTLLVSADSLTDALDAVYVAGDHEVVGVTRYGV